MAEEKYALESDPIYTESIDRLSNDAPVLARDSAFERLILRILNNVKAIWKKLHVIQDKADAAIPSSEKGMENGVASLDAGGKIAQRVDYDKLDGAPESMPANGGHSDTAASLKTACTIGIYGGVIGTATSFDGSKNILIPVTGLNMSQATEGVLPAARGGTGSASLSNVTVGSAVRLQNAYTINGIPFDGTKNITITAAAAGGTSAACSGNAATATKLQTARTIAVSGGATGTATGFNGSANITIPVTALDVSKASAGILPTARGGTGNSSLQATRNAMGLGNTIGVLPVANGGTGTNNLANVTVGKANACNGLAFVVASAAPAAVVNNRVTFSYG